MEAHSGRDWMDLGLMPSAMRVLALLVKNPPANASDMRDVGIRSQGWEDILEEDMVTHSSILAWRIPMDRGAWQATVHRAAKSQIQLRKLSTQACTWWGWGQCRSKQMG